MVVSTEIQSYIDGILHNKVKGRILSNTLLGSIGAALMAIPENRLQLMEYLGSKQKNTVWSWCAVNEEERKVYFSVWVDTRAKRDGKRDSYIIQGPDWGVDDNTGSMSAARKDHDGKLSLVFDEGYEAYGYFIEAKDEKAHPREIGHTRTSFIFLLELERQKDGSVLGYPKRRIEIR